MGLRERVRRAAEGGEDKACRYVRARVWVGVGVRGGVRVRVL